MAGYSLALPMGMRSWPSCPFNNHLPPFAPVPLPLRDHSDADDSIWCRWPSHWQCPPAVQHPSADAWQTISQHVLHRSWERRHCHRGVTRAAGPGGKPKGLYVASFVRIEHGSHRRKCVGAKGSRNRQGRNEMFAHGWVVKSLKINGLGCDPVRHCGAGWPWLFLVFPPGGPSSYSSDSWGSGSCRRKGRVTWQRGKGDIGHPGCSWYNQTALFMCPLLLPAISTLLP